jgi:hypothetical protein
MTKKTLDKEIKKCPLIEKCKSYYEIDRKICSGEKGNYTECVAYSLNTFTKKTKCPKKEERGISVGELYDAGLYNG